MAPSARLVASGQPEPAHFTLARGPGPVGPLPGCPSSVQVLFGSFGLCSPVSVDHFFPFPRICHLRRPPPLRGVREREAVPTHRERDATLISTYQKVGRSPTRPYASFFGP